MTDLTTTDDVWVRRLATCTSELTRAVVRYQRDVIARWEPRPYPGSRR
jgi:hypothetical protein